MKAPERHSWPMRALWVALAVLVAGCATPAADDGSPATAPADRAANLAWFGLEDDPMLGDPDAPVVVAVFDAPKCESCALWHLHGLPDLEASRIDDGEVVLYFVQSTIGYAFDRDGGRAMECVFRHGGDDPDGSYRAFADHVYSEQREFTAENVHLFLEEHAAARGLDADVLKACYDDGETEDAVAQDWAARERTGSGGQTPVFQVFGRDGEAVKADTRTLEDAIEAALA